jgi:hypothetical protein
MIRDRFRDQDYFDRGIAFKQAAIDKRRSNFAGIALPDRQTGCATDMWTYSTKLVIQRYSRGDPPRDLQVSVEQMRDLLALRQATLANPRLDEKDRAMYGRLDLATLYESLTLSRLPGGAARTCDGSPTRLRVDRASGRGCGARPGGERLWCVSDTRRSVQVPESLRRVGRGHRRITRPASRKTQEVRRGLVQADLANLLAR